MVLTAHGQFVRDISVTTPIKLDIASGQNKTKGFVGIDLGGDADIKADLFQFPWPIKDNSVKEVTCNHFVEHIPHYLEGHKQDGWWVFWEEVYRICTKKATLRFTHPYAMSGRADWDPTHTRRIHEMTWYYLDKTWRQSQGLDHYMPESVDFEVTLINGMGLSDEIMNRSIEHQTYARNYYWNVVGDLDVQLKIRK